MNKTSLRLCLCFVLLAFTTTLVQAQSGRRQPQPISPATPVPTPTPEATQSPKKQTNDRSEVGFVVAMDLGSGYTTYPTSYFDVVQQGCANRLRSGSSAWVEVVMDHMNRAEAMKRAKSETTGNVVWLQLTNNSMGHSSQSDADIEIEYVVYAPGTGKTVTSGRGYQNPRQSGPLILSPKASNSALYREQLLKMAAEDIADRILHALNLVVASPIPN